MTIPVPISHVPITSSDLETSRAESFLEELFRIIRNGTTGATLNTPATTIPSTTDPAVLVPLEVDTAQKQLLYRQEAIALVRLLGRLVPSTDEVSATPGPNLIVKSRADGTIDPGWLDLDGMSAGTFVALNDVAAGDPVYWSTTDDSFDKGLASVDAQARVFGVSSAAVVAGASGVIVRRGIATAVLLGATAGAPYYLAPAGGLTPTVPGSGNRIILCGYAKNSTDLEVVIQDYGKKT